LGKELQNLNFLEIGIKKFDTYNDTKTKNNSYLNTDYCSQNRVEVAENFNLPVSRIQGAPLAFANHHARRLSKHQSSWSIYAKS
jgi:hypothetical protein